MEPILWTFSRVMEAMEDTTKQDMLIISVEKQNCSLVTGTNSAWEEMLQVQENSYPLWCRDA